MWFTLLLSSWSAIGAPTVHLNQIGFQVGKSKSVIIEDNLRSEVTITESQTDKVVFRPKIVRKSSGIQQIDFSLVNTPGRYHLRIGDLKIPIRIKSNPFHKLKIAALKSYYFQRSSVELEKLFAGDYRRAAGHPDIRCLRHESLGSGPEIHSPGGWYDAGDYGKYIVSTSVTIATLLNSLELFPHSFKDGGLSIPESGNGLNDLADEIKIGLDWILTMQDLDGSIFTKLTTLRFPGMIMPEADLNQRYVIGKSTPAAFDFAATLAKASRYWQHIDATYATKLLEKSEMAWAWAISHPGISFKNPDDVKTGEYPDELHSDEEFWAATELYLTTGKPEYELVMTKYQDNFRDLGRLSWDIMAPLAHLSLSNSANSGDWRAWAQSAIILKADLILKEIDESDYLIPQVEYKWGSNADFANYGTYLLYAAKITGNSAYEDGAIKILDYLLGKNPLGRSFVTGFGTHPPYFIHHRPSASDRIKAPIPGFLVGGPNQGREDEIDGVVYPHKKPELSYVDQVQSYASNEVAINWNAPFVLLLSGLAN